ncbi:uncharacterized protein LOC128222205 [Mya arenaria]|uniref:uncharacterized protein LOC128222205 n=1 Tax=Mya arenaria TaxID=6604 RepID=UPI0022E0ADAF|nr:uncharacterized protein LOC128222205 [Mya arenaria]
MAESIETRHENWLRVVWGLLYVREGLQGYVDTKGKQQYQTFISIVNAKCNNQTCDQCQINYQCQNGKTKVTGKSKFRPAHFCDAMYKEIQNNHAGNNPFWMNTDSTKWQDPHVGYWEVTKCYLSSAGYFDKIGASQMDASGLLSICINSSFIKQHITNIQQFEEVRDIRNKTLHDARYEIDEKTANDCLDKMITVLQDPQELIHDTFAQRAAHLIINIKAKIEKTPAVMTETLHKWLQTNFDVDKHLKEIEGLMYDRLRKELKGFIVDEVKREVKHRFDDRGNYEREHNLEDLRQRLAKYYQKTLNSAPISPLLSDSNERLDKFYVPPKIVEQDPRKVGAVEKEKGTPVTAYRQLFCKSGYFRKNVFMVGEAGMGKSTCAAMCALKWANQFSLTNTINEPDKDPLPQNSCMSTVLKHVVIISMDFKHIFNSDTKQDDQFKDETFCKNIDFLFHLTLRDSCDLCDLTDMIRDQLINRIYQQDQRDAAYLTMQSVLSNNKCVIIADGLDEWTHPNDTKCSCPKEEKVIPYLDTTLDATVLITSRPWRMSQQRVKDTKIDTYLEIEGTSDIGLLIWRVLNSLNETVTVKKTLLDFIKFVERMKLIHLLSVPIISMLLVCLWFEGIHESFSLCDIYAYTIEMMLGRKALPMRIVSQENIPFLRCFQQTEYVQKYYSIVMEIAELAFTTLFSSEQTSSLVFKKVDNLKHDTLLFVLKSGILQESKSASLIRKSSSYSFIHKTVQEFLAAIYMSNHPKEFKRVVPLFYEKNDEMSDISQVFIFMCGMNMKLANEMSAMISNNISNSIKFYLDDSIQKTIVSGYKEAKASKVLNIQLSLISFDLEFCTDTEIVYDLLSMNKSKVRSINVSYDISQAKLQEVISCSTNTLTYVSLHKVTGQYNLSACNNLQDLTIIGSETTNIEINTNNLKSLHLNCVSKTVEYSILQSLKYRSVMLKYLKLKHITNMSLFCQTLPLLTNLKRLRLGSRFDTYLSSSGILNLIGMKNVPITDLGDHDLLLPASLHDVRLEGVTMTGRCLRGMVERQKNSANFSLLGCTVEPNTEYIEIKRYLQKSEYFVSAIRDDYLMFTSKKAEVVGI